MPWAWNCWTVPWTRWLRSALTIGSGGSIVDERAERRGDRVDELLAGPVELLLAERRAQRRVPLLEGLELAEMLADPFVVEFGELLLLHGGDLDGEVGLALGALRRRGERQFVAGRSADRAARRSRR